MSSHRKVLVGRGRLRLYGGCILLILLLILLLSCSSGEKTEPSSVKGVPSSPLTGFEQASPGRVFEFPGDHGPHLEYQTEWWYYTGNLNTVDGKRFGYQLTFFRRGLQPPSMSTQRDSTWATDQVYMAHFAITNVEEQQYQYFERIERGAAGLAGARTEPSYEVWLLDWSVEQTDSNQYRLIASEGDVSLSLELEDALGPILQGEGGYSRKGNSTGNASYYYSLPQLKSSGTIKISGKSYPVEGLSWMDHEFSTSALEKDQIGWDWFALQLDDGSSLMVATIRDSNGQISEFSQGLLIFPDGSTRYIARQDFSITTTGIWTSPHSGAKYPNGWKITVPGEDLSLEVIPLVIDQELNVSFTYWEGAVSVVGERKGEPITGQGYVELTGYAQSMQGKL